MSCFKPKQPFTIVKEKIITIEAGNFPDIYTKEQVIDILRSYRVFVTYMGRIDNDEFDKWIKQNV